MLLTEMIKNLIFKWKCSIMQILSNLKNIRWKGRFPGGETGGGRFGKGAREDEQSLD